MLRSKDIQQRLKDIDNYLLDEYKKSKKEKKRNWRTYEQQLANRLKKGIENLEPLIEEATKNIKTYRKQGNKPSLTLKQKLKILLLQRLFGKSNRMMASLCSLFSLLSEINVGYKTVERLYSDEEVEIALHNLHILILKKKGVTKVNGSGDGTGYSLTIKKHYASVRQKKKEKVKKSTKKKKSFVYSFKLLDLNTWLYVCYGMSLKSEKEAFDRAYKMLEEMNIEVEDMRLDKYYSFPSYIDKFGDTKVYIIPRKNATLKGSWKWKRLMNEFVNDTLPYLEEYYLRNHSEASFSVDKRWFGWKIDQRREDRIDTAIVCGNLWHNVFNLYPN